MDKIDIITQTWIIEAILAGLIGWGIGKILSKAIDAFSRSLYSLKCREIDTSWQLHEDRITDVSDRLKISKHQLIKTIICVENNGKKDLTKDMTHIPLTITLPNNYKLASKEILKDPFPLFFEEEGENRNIIEGLYGLDVSETDDKKSLSFSWDLFRSKSKFYISILAYNEECGYDTSAHIQFFDSLDFKFLVPDLSNGKLGQNIRDDFSREFASNAPYTISLIFLLFTLSLNIPDIGNNIYMSNCQIESKYYDNQSSSTDSIIYNGILSYDVKTDCFVFSSDSLNLKIPLEEVNSNFAVNKLYIDSDELIKYKNQIINAASIKKMFRLTSFYCLFMYILYIILRIFKNKKILNHVRTKHQIPTRHKDSRDF